MEEVQQLIGLLRQQLEHPLAVPVTFSLAALLFSIVLLYACAAGGSKTRARTPRASAAAGTVVQDGVRRSTRQHKQVDKYSPEKVAASPAPAKTPRAVRTPKAKKADEAVTVTPKATKPRASRAAKTPATAEPATARTRRGAAKTPAK